MPQQKKGVKTCLFMALLISSFYAHAERDYGNVSCGQWIEDKQNDIPVLKISDMRWLGGYLSGLNTAWTAIQPQKDPLSQLTSLEQASDWIDNYCKTNSLGNLKEGTTKLFMELVKMQKNQQPN